MTRSKTMMLSCDVPGCTARAVSRESESWEGVYRLARAKGWAIREDVPGPDGSRKRSLHLHYCPEHRLPSSRYE